MPLIAITGVPGTGKSTLGERLSESGEKVIDLHKTVLAYDLILGKDEQRDSLEVDLDGLSGFVAGLEGTHEMNIFLEGHLSHLLPVETIIVLRCHPDVLKKRLEQRGWSKEKITENLEAEAMGVITQEAADSPAGSYEIDVTDIKVEDILAHVLNIVQGKHLEDYRPGGVDFFQEILKWY